MESFFCYLNENAGVLTVLFTGIVTFSTMVYAILTWRLVTETRIMRKAQTEPLVSVTVQPLKEYVNLLEMVIENIGSGPAFEIQFALDQDIDILNVRKLSEINVIKKGINYLAPSQKISFLCADISTEVKKSDKLILTLRVKYKDRFKTDYEVTFSIDIFQYFGILQLGEPTIYTIKKSLESIQKDIHKLVSAQPRLKVDTFTSEDRKSERKKFEEIEKSQKK